LGNDAPMKDFLKKREAIPFTGELPTASTFSITIAPGWAEGAKRYIAADVQGSGGLHLWVAVVDVTKDGGAHLVDYLRLTSFEQLRDVQVLHGVPFTRVGVDVKWAERRQTVLGWGACYGWTALAAFPQKQWLHEGGRLKPWTVSQKSQAGAKSPDVARGRMLMRTQKEIDPPASVRPPLFSAELGWAKDFFAGLLLSLLEKGKLSFAPGAGLQEEAHRQLLTRTEGKDHFRDCLQMILVLAMRRGANFS
jgi:hypothetical protein